MVLLFSYAWLEAIAIFLQFLDGDHYHPVLDKRNCYILQHICSRCDAKPLQELCSASWPHVQAEKSAFSAYGKHKQMACVGHWKVKQQWSHAEEIIIWFDGDVLHSTMALSDMENEISHFWLNNMTFWGMPTSAFWFHLITGKNWNSTHSCVVIIILLNQAKKFWKLLPGKESLYLKGNSHRFLWN